MPPGCRVGSECSRGRYGPLPVVPVRGSARVHRYSVDRSRAPFQRQPARRFDAIKPLEVSAARRCLLGNRPAATASAAPHTTSGFS